MAKDMKPTDNEQRYFDIVPPNRKMPQPTSRPVIVGNHPEQTDPMVKEKMFDFEVDSKKENSEPAAVEEKMPDSTPEEKQDNKPETVTGTLPENDKPVPEIAPQPAEKLLPASEEANEPLLPANASPELTVTAISMPKTTKKRHLWPWIISIIIVLLLVVAIVIIK
jgi:hypothetical protein